MNDVTYEITAAGQIVAVTRERELVTNTEQIMRVLKDQINEPVEAAPAAPRGNPLISYHNLGDGVCAFQRESDDRLHTFGGVMLQKLPFLTQWALDEQDGQFALIPHNGRGEVIDIGAPMMMDIPEDLIVHFFVEWHNNLTENIVTPTADLVWKLPRLLRAGQVRDCYLTAFSRSRNTCVRLPLPNLYGDAHLCTGSSFTSDEFKQPMNHWGLTTSIKSYAKWWSQTAWNLDLLGGSDSRLMKQYRRFVRFDANTGKYLPFSGCADWELSTSPVPLEEVYKPWMSNERPTMPEIVPGEENLTVDGEEPMPQEEPEPQDPNF